MGVLDGRVVAVLEARRAQEMADLVRRHGGTPYPAPALKEVPLENQPEISAFFDRLTAEPVAAALFLTGVGTAALFAAADARDRLPAVLAALERTTVAARGPKPVAVLRRHGVRIDRTAPEPNTSHELLAALEDVDVHGKMVAIQHYGQPATLLRERLIERGAKLLEVSVYGWEMPDDQGPLTAFIADVQAGGIDAVAATSQAQVQNLFRLAKHFGQTAALREALNRRVAVAAVGPVCAAAWVEWGVAVDVEPDHPKMGHLVLAIGAHLQQHGRKGA